MVRDRGVEHVEFVGHPLSGEVKAQFGREEFCRRNDLDPSQTDRLFSAWQPAQRVTTNSAADARVRSSSFALRDPDVHLCGGRAEPHVEETREIMSQRDSESSNWSNAKLARRSPPQMPPRSPAAPRHSKPHCSKRRWSLFTKSRRLTGTRWDD
jgi:hypothetical protein